MYTAWGEDSESSTSDWAKENPIRYNGQYLDSETGFYYLRARYYDPSIHRFTSEDPAEDGLNWYAYCGNNPVMFSDPSGENYDDIINNLAKIYKSKNIMNVYVVSTVEYADAYDEAIKAKSEIANDEFYINNYLDLKNILLRIINSDDNSIDSIKTLIDTVTQIKNNDTNLKNKQEDPTIVSIIGGSFVLGVDVVESLVQAITDGVNQKNIDDATSYPTPAPTPIPVGPPEDIEDIRATINFN